MPRHCAEANLQSLLAQAHQIISLLHGPIEGLLLQVRMPLRLLTACPWPAA